MAIEATYPIGLTSVVNEFNPNFTPRGVVIANYAADNLAFDNTVDPILLIPPGVRAPIVIGHYVSTLRIRSATNTTGAASITIMDSIPDMTGAPNLQQLPGTITAAIPSVVTTTGTITNTVTTQGVAPIGARVHCNNSTQFVTLTRETTHIRVQCDETTLNVGGQLNIYTQITLPDTTTDVIYTVASGYLLPSTYGAQNSALPFKDDIELPAGALVFVFFSGQADFIVSY